MNIKSKLTLAIGILVAMIVLLVVLSVVNLQILPRNLTVRQQVPDYSGLYCGYMLLVPHVYVLVLVCGCVFPHQLIILLKS